MGGIWGFRKDFGGLEVFGNTMVGKEKALWDAVGFWGGKFGFPVRGWGLQVSGGSFRQWGHTKDPQNPLGENPKVTSTSPPNPLQMPWSNKELENKVYLAQNEYRHG